MTTNKDDFKTTYSKVKGFHIIGYNADTDEFSKLHVDENGHIYAKMLGEYDNAAITLEADSSGRLKVSLDSQTVPVTGDFYPTTQPVSASSLPLPSGAATLAKQDSQLTYQATLESLVDTLHELCQRLAPLGGSISMVGGQALRVNTGGSTFAVSGPILATDYHLAGRNWPIAMALHNLAAKINIDNVTAA